jgi:hypothetical protein
MGKEVYKMSDRMKVMMNMFRKTKRRNHRMAAMMVGGMGIVAAMATTAAFMVKKKRKMKHDQPMEHCDFDSSSEDDNYQI